MFGLLRRYQAYRKAKKHKYLSEKWPSVRKKGKWHFVCYRAILLALISTSVSILTDLYRNRHIFPEDAVSSHPMLSFIVWFMVGFVSGMLLAEGEWARTEAKYLKFRKKGEPSPS